MSVCSNYEYNIFEKEPTDASSPKAPYIRKFDALEVPSQDF